MKVLHVLNNYLPQQVAGTEIYVSALVRELKPIKVESVILIPNTKNENEEYFFEDTRVIRYPESSIANRDIITGKKAPDGLHKFLEILENEKPDIVHFHELAGSIGIGIFHLRSVHALGYKIVITFHLVKYSCRTGTLMYMNKIKCDGKIQNVRCSKCCLNNMGIYGFKANLINVGFTLMNLINVDTRFFKNTIGTALAFPKIIEETKSILLELEFLSNRLIVLNNWFSNILINNGVKESNLSIIEQGIPNSYIKSNNVYHGNSVLRLIFVGRISHFKGVDLLIKSIKKLPHDKVSLDIYGSSTEDTYLNECYNLSDGASNIFWKGNLEPNLVISTIEMYDVLCIPSTVAEMGPFVLKEAFAAGIPVLASDVYGNAEQIAHNINGWLFKYKDLDSLKNQLQALINNPSLVTKAKQNIKPVRNFDFVAKDHFDIYSNILTTQ